VKRWAILITIVFCVGLALIAFIRSSPATVIPSPITSTPSATPVIAAKKIPTITIGTEQFTYAVIRVQTIPSVSLIPNFTKPKDVESRMKENNCTSAINGGFYDKAGKPLGYFQTGTSIVGSKIDSDLVNGFVWADASGAAVISTRLPHETFRFAIQTGPMLVFDGNKLPLNIRNDTRARRMVAAKSMDNQLLFLTVYSADSVFDGPLLGDLPTSVMAVSTKENLNIADAINLDGGSASAFYSGDTSLSELTSVGSIFCVK